MKKSNMLLLCMLLLSGIFMPASFAYDFSPSSGAGLIITKSALSPVPAEPGKDILLEVTINNYGQSEAKNLAIEIQPSTGILLANENERIIYKESLCSLCTMTNTYHLHADPRAVSGDYEVKIRATRSEAGGSFGIAQAFNITIKGKPQLGLSDISLSPAAITPGKISLWASLLQIMAQAWQTQ